MKKIALFLICVLLTSLSVAQNYNNIVNYNLNGTPVNGVKIKTNIPFDYGLGMPAIKIEGFNYNSTGQAAAPIIASMLNLNLGWYVYNNTFYTTTISSSGGSTPDVWLSNENGKIVIFLDQKIYYQRFTVSAFAQGKGEKPEYFEGWTVVDEPRGGTSQTQMVYKNIFAGNVGIGTDNPQNKLHVIGTIQPSDGIRIGSISDGGTRSVPVGSITKQLNLDFTGYRDVNSDQIGARISAIRYNKYLEYKAYIQNTALAFFTNEFGNNAGTTDLLERMRISPNGFVGIGTTAPDKLLTVNGTIHAKEVIIDTNFPVADYVFKSDYKLMPLHEVEQFVKTNNHLPEVPSAAQVEQNGMNIGEMQNKLLQKIEELTLYVIEQNKEIKALKEENNTIKKQLNIE